MLQIRKILYPTDFSRASRQALPHALFLARELGAELLLFHAEVLHGDRLNDAQFADAEPAELLERLAGSEEARAAAALDEQALAGLTIRKTTRRGFNPGAVILEYAGEEDVDLVVMGTHGRRGPASLLLGSVAGEVVRLAPCPTLTVRERKEPRPVDELERILVPVDFSEHCRTALAYALELARRYDARIDLLHVIEQPAFPTFYSPSADAALASVIRELGTSSQEAMDRLMADAEADEVPFEKHVIEGRASVDVVEFAGERGADMIVLATHGLTGLERVLFGSTAEQVVRRAECPVFTVKAFGKSLIRS